MSMLRASVALTLLLVLAWPCAAFGSEENPWLHTVKRGETLSGLAARYGASLEKMARINGLSPKAGLRRGATLRIPFSAENPPRRAKREKLLLTCMEPDDVPDQLRVKCRNLRWQQRKLKKLCTSGKRLGRRDRRACARLKYLEDRLAERRSPVEAAAAKAAKKQAPAAASRPSKKPATAREQKPSKREAPKPRPRRRKRASAGPQLTGCELLTACADHREAKALAVRCKTKRGRNTHECVHHRAAEKARSALARSCRGARYRKAHGKACEKSRDEAQQERRLSLSCRRAPKATKSRLAACTRKAALERWARYHRKPKKPGYVRLRSVMGRFQGYLLKNGKVNPAAQRSVKMVWASKRTGQQRAPNSDLLEAVAELSDHFGGREIVIVSGFRPRPTNLYNRRSRHNEGRAVDFKIEGVPNQALHAFCRTLEKVGCGYYPNSSFIHMDVRQLPFHWTDYAGPGEPPMYAHEGWVGRYKRKGKKGRVYPRKAWKRYRQRRDARKAKRAAAALETLAPKELDDNDASKDAAPPKDAATPKDAAPATPTSKP